MLGFFIAREHRAKFAIAFLILAVLGLIGGIVSGSFTQNNRQYKTEAHQIAD